MDRVSLQHNRSTVVYIQYEYLTRPAPSWTFLIVRRPSLTRHERFTGASGDSVMGRDNFLKGDELIAALTTHLANRAMDPSVPSSMNEIVTDTSSRASLWIMGEIKGLNSSYEDFSLSPKEKDQVGTIVTSLVTLYANDEETFLADIQVDLVLVHEAEEILLKESASASGSSTNNNSSAAEESPLAVLNQKLDAAAMTSDEERERVLLGNLDLLSQGMERITMLTRRLIERETETSQADATNMWDLMAESGDGLPARAHQLRRSLFVLRERRVPTLDEYRSMMPTSLQKAYDEDVLGKK